MTFDPNSFDPDAFNFNRCEDEPIHIPEAIQGYGYLFAVDPDSGEIRVHSENLDSFIMEESTDCTLLGKNFFDLIDLTSVSKEFIKESYNKAKSESLRLPLQLRFRADKVTSSESLDYHAVVFSSGDYMVIEVEPASTFKSFVTVRQYGKIYATNIAPTFRSIGSVEGVTGAIAHIIKELTGFERVVVYRFNEDGSGQVIGEAKVDDIESYLDFFYPPDDIPPQARALYLKNWIRLNPNVNISPVGLVPSINESGRKPLDLTHSLLRAMSPIHVQYVRNQGLCSSMSISLIHSGKLWGLVSCHHRQQHYMPQDVRLECESLGHLFGWQIYAKQEEIKLKKKAVIDTTIDELIDELSDDIDILGLFKKYDDKILGLMDSHGFAFYSGNETVTIGTVPTRELIQKINQVADQRNPKVPFATHSLPELIGDKNGLNNICGALVIPLLSQPGYFTVWFREENQRVIKWAGNPQEKQKAVDKKARLTPRASFEIHAQHIDNESLPWSDEDIELAERFNKLFLRHALKRKMEMQADISILREQDQTKNEFLATLAHELRNPLSPISNSVSILKTADNPEFKTRAFDIIERQLKHMVTLVDDLLDVSRITRGKIRMEKLNLDLVDVLKNSLETNAPLVKEKQHNLTFQVREEDKPIVVHGDFTRLTQLYGNIIHNAAKYTDNGGDIRISIFKEGANAIVEIKDSGVGIPKDYIGKIFDMFSQVEANSTQTRGGLGIGLTLVKSLVQLHDGEISVQSEGAGKGSQFRISLPIAETLEVENDNKMTNNTSTGRSQRKKVLVVDDNVDVTTTLEMVIEMLGHEVEVRNSSVKVLKDFGKIAPDVAFLDIGLPDIDGYDLCRRLKSEHPNINTIFVAQTGWGAPEHIEKSKESGFDYHYVKPVSAETVNQFFEENFGAR